MTEIRRDHLTTGKHDSRQLGNKRKNTLPVNFTAATREKVTLTDCTVLTTKHILVFQVAV